MVSSLFVSFCFIFLPFLKIHIDPNILQFSSKSSVDFQLLIACTHTHIHFSGQIFQKLVEFKIFKYIFDHHFISMSRLQGHVLEKNFPKSIQKTNHISGFLVFLYHHVKIDLFLDKMRLKLLSRVTVNISQSSNATITF